MSTTAKTTKKILPKPAKRQDFKTAQAETIKQYAKTLEKLAQ